MGSGTTAGEDICLRDLLKDRSRSISERRNAAEALAASGAPEGCRILERVLLDRKEDHRLRMAAARALGAAGCRRSLPSLKRALDDGCPAVRHEAIAALGSLGCPEAAPELERLLGEDSRYLKSLAARSLLKTSGIPEPIPENLERLFKLLASGDDDVIIALLKVGSPALEFLEAKVQSSSFCERQLSSKALAWRARRSLDGLIPGEDPLEAVPLSSMAKLYSFRADRSKGYVRKVENSGFDEVSRTLRGKRSLNFPAPVVLEGGKGCLDLDHLLSSWASSEPTMMGRTLVVPIKGKCLALKCCARPEDEAHLAGEAAIQRYLRQLDLSSIIPSPLGGLIDVKGLSPFAMKKLGASSSQAICYMADRDYFVYLNDPRIPQRRFRDRLASCADDLATMVGMGLIHRSLIPLFHRRESTGGRDDGGTYCWNRGVAGRLDGWLESCRYPNLRLSGLADFEHLQICREISSEGFQAYVGEHLLSLSLILGSYFKLRGYFDREEAESALRETFEGYCLSLTGRKPGLEECLDWGDLVSRMAEEMDGHSSEHLGVRLGPFPLPELVRAIHLTSLFAVLEVQPGLQPGC